MLKVSISQIIESLPTFHQVPINQFLVEHEEWLKLIPGSSGAHQNWDGGYLEHLTQMMNFAIRLYSILEKQIFEISDCLVVLFWHDVEKMWKYAPREHRINFESKQDRKKIPLGYS